MTSVGFIDLLNSGPDPHLSPLFFIISFHITWPSVWKSGIYFKFPSRRYFMEASGNEFAEIMRKDLSVKSNRNTFRPHVPGSSGNFIGNVTGSFLRPS